MRRFLPLLPVLVLTACGQIGLPCSVQVAVITDIDETLTIHDGEWLAQMVDPGHDPQMRPDAAELLRRYDDRYFTVFYISARPEAGKLSDGTTARQATRAWLELHGFPIDDGRLFLMPGNGSFSDEAIASYKASVIEEIELAGWPVAYAYGNAETDIDAFRRAGVPDGNIFLVGDLAGDLGVNAVFDEDAFVVHALEHMANVDDAECGY
jgi:hypothetical protein